MWVVLHRKETLVSCDHPGYSKFRDLTRVGEGTELYSDVSSARTELGCGIVLYREGVAVRGYKVGHPAGRS